MIFAIEVENCKLMYMTKFNTHSQQKLKKIFEWRDIQGGGRQIDRLWDADEGDRVFQHFHNQYWCFPAKHKPWPSHPRVSLHCTVYPQFIYLWLAQKVLPLPEPSWPAKLPSKLRLPGHARWYCLYVKFYSQGSPCGLHMGLDFSMVCGCHRWVITFLLTLLAFVSVTKKHERFSSLFERTLYIEVWLFWSLSLPPLNQLGKTYASPIYRRKEDECIFIGNSPLTLKFPGKLFEDVAEI